MSYKPAPVPALPANVDPQLRQFLTAIKESLEVRTRQRGSPLDASPTFRDLLDTGLLKIKDGVTTIGGRQYTAEQLLGLVEFSLPSWVTSDTAPPAPTGLVVTTDKTNTILKWNASTFDQYSHTEIWRADYNNLSAAEKVGSTSGNTYTDSLPDAGSAYYYWIRDVAYNTLVGPFNDVNGTGTVLGPGTVVVTRTFIGADVDFSWPTPTSNLAVAMYRIEYFDGGWLLLDVVAGNSHRFRVTWGGTRQFRIAAIDINGEQGLFTNFNVVVVVPAAPNVEVTFDGEQVLLTWSAPSASLLVDRYEIYDTSVATNNLLATLSATAFRTKVTWLNKNLLVRAIDSAGNAGTIRTVPVNITPGQVINLTTEVIDNNVLFRWDNVPGSLPIATYDLRRGPVWATAADIGRKDGGFTTVFEAPQTQEVYTYWLTAIDTAGNYGPPTSVTATVNQPPDYVLARNFISTFSGTRVSAATDGIFLVMPVDIVQTWQDHFTSRGWASPQAQVNAGYPIFIQPGNLTGYYEEDFDYGTVLAAMKIGVTFREIDVAGFVATTVTITTALDANFTTNVQTYTGTQAYAINFRFVRIRITANATTDQGITEIADLTVKLDTKLKSQTGALPAVSQRIAGTYSQTNTTITVTAASHGWTTGQRVQLQFTSGLAVDGMYIVTGYTQNTFTVTAATAQTTSGNVDVDNDGSIVYLTEDRTSTGVKTFVDVESITVSANTTSPVYAIYDFVDAPSPLSFKVLLYNSSGTRISGTVSYSVRGY